MPATGIWRGKYAELLYGQALLIAGVPLEDASRFSELVCELMNK
jgi:molecular chaperone HtpG